MQADKYQLQTTEISNRAFGKVSIDLIVDLPVSHNGNKNILVMVDQLTSWPIAIAITDKEATTVANAIHKDLILQHGAPEILLSDNDKEFYNDTLAYVCQEYGIAQHFTSPYVTRQYLGDVQVIFRSPRVTYYTSYTFDFNVKYSYLYLFKI